MPLSTEPSRTSRRLPWKAIRPASAAIAVGTTASSAANRTSAAGRRREGARRIGGILLNPASAVNVPRRLAERTGASPNTLPARAVVHPEPVVQRLQRRPLRIPPLRADLRGRDRGRHVHLHPPLG